MMSQKMMAVAGVALFAAGVGFGLGLSPTLAAGAAMAGAPPTKVLIDNERLKVNLVSFPKDFHRDGGEKRANDTLIVYLDPGDFKVIPKPGAAPNPIARGERTPESPIGLDGEVSKNPHKLGTVTWHPKGSEEPTLVTNAAYRALYIEIKK